jgi:magnesium transporter
MKSEQAPEHSMDPRTGAEEATRESVVNNAVYLDGRRVDSPDSLSSTIAQ